MSTDVQFSPPPIENAIITLAAEGKAPELWQKLRDRALDSLYFFTKVILGYKDLSPILHQEFCQEIQKNVNDRKHGYLMPRGHFKSTIISKAYPLWRICHNREARILIVGESDKVAKKNMRDIKWNILNNQILRWLFPEIIPGDTNNTKWTDEEILLPRDGTYDESTITMIGVGAKTTGFHYDVIIYDDIIGEKAAKSEAEMESAITWFQYAPGLLNDPANGEEVLIGTRWKHGAADLYGYIMQELPEAVSESGRQTGFVWYVRAAIEDNVPIFPERFSLETLEEIRKREKDYKFSCQYMNDPIAPGSTDFLGADLREYIVGEDNKTLIPQDGTPPIKLAKLLRFSFYDPSSGGKKAKAENAIVVVGESPDRRIFVLEAWARNCGFSDAIEKWHIINDHFHIYQNFFEDVGAQKVIIDIFAERFAQLACRLCQKQHRKFIPLPEKPPGGDSSKEDRIRLYLQPAVTEHRIYLRRGMQKLRQQVVGFPHGDMVDLLDALAYAVHKARPPLSDEQIEEEKQTEREHREARKPRTNTEYNYGGYI